mmetsp:Transcript_10972/g.45689  ORF Transcript_10972/g.45689 Transcript_10972/m.45689 type:complete len:157 (-) Transcript_10972:507-977(-)
MTLAEYQIRLALDMGAIASEPTIHRALEYLKLTRKKKQRSALRKQLPANLRRYPLSWELRLQIIRLHEQGLSIRQIARRTKRAVKTVHRICAKYDLMGRPTPGAQAGVRSSPGLLKVPELLYLKVKTAACVTIYREVPTPLSSFRISRDDDALDIF